MSHPSFMSPPPKRRAVRQDKAHIFHKAWSGSMASPGENVVILPLFRGLEFGVVHNPGRKALIDYVDMRLAGKVTSHEASFKFSQIMYRLVVVVDKQPTANPGPGSDYDDLQKELFKDDAFGTELWAQYVSHRVPARFEVLFDRVFTESRRSNDADVLYQFNKRFEFRPPLEVHDTDLSGDEIVDATHIRAETNNLVAFVVPYSGYGTRSIGPLDQYSYYITTEIGYVPS